MTAIESQTNQILNHLTEYGSITSWEAIQLFHVTRLSAIIYILRHKRNIDVKDRIEISLKDGRTTHYKIYYIEKEAV